jgi:signal transduction histidine kinase
VNQGFRNQFIVIEELSNEIYQIERSAYEKVIRTISHEFNNSIGPINSILDSLNAHIQKTETGNKADFETAIEVAIQRNNALNEFIRRYAKIFKLPEPLKEPCDINQLLQRLEKIFHYELRENNIAIEFSLSEQPLIWNVDVNQFELVISNIIKNAIEAIASGGKVTVQTMANPGTIIITDDGDPIPGDVQKQLFTPFFTTKTTGQGIGLTLVREILQNHQLRFSLKTLSDNTTEIRIMTG